MIRKLKNSGGVSVVEMLCAVLILTLLCLMVNTGMQMAVKSYRDVTAESETQLLLNSLADALSDKLRFAVVTVKDGATVCSIGEIKLDANGMVVVEEKNADGETVTKYFLPKGAYGNGRYEAKTAEVTCAVAGDVATFTVKLAVKEVAGSIGAETELTIRCLNPVKKEGGEAP